MRLLKVVTAVALAIPLAIPLTGGAGVSAGSAAPARALESVGSPGSSVNPVTAAPRVDMIEVADRAAPRRAKYVALNAALAKKCMKKLQWAVQYGADNVAHAIGLLEIETYSFEGQYAPLKAQAIDMGLHEAYNVKVDLRQLDDEIWRGLKMWDAGDRRKAVRWWIAVLRIELLPALRTYVGAFRAKAETLSRDAKAALVAIGKPWVINPDVDDSLERSFDQVQGALGAAWKIATKRVRR